MRSEGKPQRESTQQLLQRGTQRASSKSDAEGRIDELALIAEDMAKATSLQDAESLVERATSIVQRLSPEEQRAAGEYYGLVVEQLGYVRERFRQNA